MGLSSAKLMVIHEIENKDHPTFLLHFQASSIAKGTNYKFQTTIQNSQPTQSENGKLQMIEYLILHNILLRDELTTYYVSRIDMKLYAERK